MIDSHTHKADVRVHLKEASGFPESEPANPPENIYVSPSKDEHGFPVVRIARFSRAAHYGFFYNDGARFAVDRAGREIWADWPDRNYTLEDAATYLMGPIIGFVLRLKGVLPLHASVVSIGEHAVALIGGPGAGKSTTAAAFATLGYPVLSDDVAALREEGGGFLVQPGYPRVNLWPDSVQLLFGTNRPLSRISPTWDKQFMALDRNGLTFERRALPLGAIYFLGEREVGLCKPVIEKIEGPSALVRLVANTYVNYVIDSDMRQREFSSLNRLLAQVPVRLVRPPADASCLGKLCEAIRASAMQLIGLREISDSQERS